MTYKINRLHLDKAIQAITAASDLQPTPGFGIVSSEAIHVCKRENGTNILIPF